eukprot:3423383-Prymnesium_polylepis.2
MEHRVLIAHNTVTIERLKYEHRCRWDENEGDYRANGEGAAQPRLHCTQHRSRGYTRAAPAWAL